jgi:hypothetical protein
MSTIIDNDNPNVPSELINEKESTNPNNYFNNINNHKLTFDEITNLKCVRNTIENLNKKKQIEILRILNNCKYIKFNENAYGIHINMNEIPRDVISKITEYIEYIMSQDVKLQRDETNISQTYN